MPATLIWGKGFRTEEVTLPSGRVCLEVSGIDGFMEMLSWSSVEGVQSLAERYGIDRSTWPVYPDCEIPSEIPLEDAQRLSAELRIALVKVDSRVLEGDYWLSLLYKILRDGNSFFIMV